MSIEDEFQKCVYGPVRSWRFGLSLGIDPIFHNSTCSFSCIYCQLGNIQNITDKRDEFVSTSKVVGDFREFSQKNIPYDVITFSGNGEPSLAKNFAQMSLGIRELATHKPQFILTNGTLLNDSEVRDDLKLMDKVIIKLDACSEEQYSAVNRPAGGLSFLKLIDGIIKFKSEYNGEIEIQSMFLPINSNQIEEFADLVNQISPQCVQVNLPKRPYPSVWSRHHRGNHELEFKCDFNWLKTISEGQVKSILKTLSEKTKVELISPLR
ncbi:MAG: radical SAM protein [Bacteriovoracaceae bacterium]|jgi:wyosine [tRNA(Phe)-imidazoG37] synthetase (radical SAM superfamily)|nr:radical SAM protein [Bacteriovoracaceae bacterium]